MAARRRREGRRGQALVEFALVAPLLLLLTLALLDFARAWNVYQVITDAAREGARTAVVANESAPATEESIKSVVGAAMARASLDASEPTTVITITGLGTGVGNPTTVRIEHQYRLGWIGALMALAQGSEQLTLTTEIVMRNE
jgi:Flp pilus assembly protein TadG